jgi:hypothetical protein
MRGYAGSAMAIVANFADHPVDVDVVVPDEAFAYFGMPVPASSASSCPAPTGHLVHFHVAAHDYTRIDVSH